MADSTTVSLTGLPELDRKFRRLPKRVQSKVLRKALDSGLQAELRQAKANALSMVGGPMGSLLEAALEIGKPKRNKKGEITRRTQFAKSSNTIFVEQTKGPSLDSKTNKWASSRRNYIPAAIEFGHGSDKEKAAIPFMRKAFETTKQTVIRATLLTLRAGVENEARKK